MAEPIDYGKVLDALMEERTNLDTMIAWAKRKLAETRAEGEIPTVETLLRGADKPQKPKVDSVRLWGGIKSDTFFKMSVTDAIEHCLNIAKKPLTAKDITETLSVGGLTHKAKDLYQTVFPTLGRMKERGIVEKLPTGEWGLAAWYGRKSAPSQTEEGK
jgi:hypothetical protein